LNAATQPVMAQTFSYRLLQLMPYDAEFRDVNQFDSWCPPR
jgi:hypothetical protein